MRPLPEPLQLQTGSAPQDLRFAVLHRPAAALRGLVLYVHPFAEELNKARHMAALQCAALANAGFMVLQADLYGCGDSPDALDSATWDGWVRDVAWCADWLAALGNSLRSTPAPLWLWGLRAGALLAVQAAPLVRQQPCHLLFWQPPGQGKALLQQFLRLRAAADMAQGQAKGVLAELRAALAGGQSVDVAGYVLPPGVALGLDAAALVPPPAAQHPAPAQLVWLEVANQPEAELLPASAAPVARWREAGWAVHAQAVQGAQFWQTAEIETAPHLLAATVAALQARCPAAPPSTPPGIQAGAALPAGSDAATLPEQPLSFPCAGYTLVGLLHRPAAGRPHSGLGVVIVVGGPQYRAGSHRQFVDLARALAAEGHAVLRFDVRGMGDSSGAPRAFDTLDDDIHAAIDQLQQHCPAATRIALWGLCDGASAALLYWQRRRDNRVAALALANPWVRSASTEARTLVRHYYLDRLRQRSFWLKLLSGGVALKALRGLADNLHAARGAAPKPASFQDGMALAWQQFPGAMLLIASGQDYTAQEFLDACGSQPSWHGALSRPGLQRQDLPAADHTFSAPGAKAAVNRATAAWLAGVSTP
jgi:exosortase A-associated hydrolase 1/exosortase A-associated hydrolase 2